MTCLTSNVMRSVVLESIIHALFKTSVELVKDLPPIFVVVSNANDVNADDIRGTSSSFV